MAEFVLEMKNVTKAFGVVKALKDVSINLRPNEILAICGENGAGKSTLMKVLSGAYAHGSYTGEILVDGQPKKFMNTADSSEAGIEMIYQEISVHLDLTVAENIFLGRIPVKNGVVQWKKMNQEAKTYLDMVGLDLPVTMKMRDLSASQCQMVSIARALSRNPKILVLDEPTSPLTEREVEALFQILFRLRDQGISCFYICHKMKEIMRLADRVCVMRDGQHIWTKDAAELTIDLVVEGMVNRKLGSMYPKQFFPLGEEVMSLKNLKIRHPHNPKKNLVEGVDIQVRKGEILGVAGLVGAQRTELMEGLFGIRLHSKGTIKYKGKELSITRPRDAIKQGIALLTEDRRATGIMGVLSIADNISIASLDQYLDMGIVINDKKIEQLVQDNVKKMSIKCPSSKTQIQSLSGGNMQKVLIGRWLANNPDVLILDEPTRGIDVGAKYEIYCIIEELARAGKSIIMISSEMAEIIGMSDRVMVMCDGRITGFIDGKDANQENIMHLATQFEKAPTEAI